MKADSHTCLLCRFLDVSWRTSLSLWIADLNVSSAVLAHNQICRGYTILVYNKAHITELFQLDEQDQRAYLEDVVRTARALHNAYHPHKINYELLGNVVPHLHVHVIPRRTTDPIDLHWPIWDKEYPEVILSDDEYLEIIEEIRMYLLTPESGTKNGI